MEGKVCTRCGEFKVFKEFNKRKSSKDGHNSHCRVCATMSQKKYREENDEKIKAYRREYSEENRERENLRKRLYKKTPEGRETKYRFKIKRKSYKYKVQFKPFQRRKLLERDNWTCQMCKCKVHDRKTDINTPDKAHLDHIIPISKGGNSEPENLQVLCRDCNIKKADKIIELVG